MDKFAWVAMLAWGTAALGCPAERSSAAVRNRLLQFVIMSEAGIPLRSMPASRRTPFANPAVGLCWDSQHERSRVSRTEFPARSLPA